VKTEEQQVSEPDDVEGRIFSPARRIYLEPSISSYSTYRSITSAEED
jgi:hypothetical protein